MSVTVKSKSGGKKKPADGEVTIDASTKNEENIDTIMEKVEVPADIVAPNEITLNAEVEFGLQAIVPTGQYQNVRVNVGIKCKCEADTEVIEATFQHLKSWVDEKITEVVTEIQNG